MSRSPIVFKETIRNAATGERKYIRYFDGRGHYAHVKLQLLPCAGELCTATRAAELNLPEDCYRATHAAIVRRLNSGPLGHFPMHGVEVQILEGTYLPGHSYPEAFAIAASMAFDEAMLTADPVILEPWIRMRLHAEPDALVEVFTTLTRLLGKVDTSITLSNTFFLDVELPKRSVPRICHLFGLRNPQTFLLPRPLEYRPLQTTLADVGSPRTDMEDWT